MSGTINPASELILVDSRTQAGTVTLPLASSNTNRRITIKDAYGTAATSSITVQTSGSDTFEDGATSMKLVNAYDTLTLYVGLSGKWSVAGGSIGFGFTASTISTTVMNALTVSTTRLQTSALTTQGFQVSSINNVNLSEYVIAQNLVSTTLGISSLILSSLGSGLVTLNSTISTVSFFTSSIVASTVLTTTGLFSSLQTEGIQKSATVSGPWIESDPLRMSSFSTQAIQLSSINNLRPAEFVGANLPALLSTTSLYTNTVNTSSILTSSIQGVQFSTLTLNVSSITANAILGNITQNVINASTITTNFLLGNSTVQARTQLFDPRSILGLQLWLDAADPSTFTYSSGSNMSRWLDKSGQGYHATPSGTVTASTNSVVLNATYLDTALTASGFSNNAFKEYGFAVFTTTNSSQYSLVGANYFQGRGISVFNGNTSAVYNVNNGGEVIANLGTQGWANGQVQLVDWSSGGYLGLNASSIVNSGSNFTSYMAPWMQRNTVIGGGVSYVGALVGTIREVIIYQGVTLSSNDIYAIEGYLASKWNFTANLPASHPYKSYDIRTSTVTTTNGIYATDSANNLTIEPVNYNTRVNLNFPNTTPNTVLLGHNDIRQTFQQMNSHNGGVSVFPTVGSFGTTYLLPNAVLSIIFPAYISSIHAGGYWDFYNDSANNQTISVTNGNPITNFNLSPYATAKVTWMGTSNFLTFSTRWPSSIIQDVPNSRFGIRTAPSYNLDVLGNARFLSNVGIGMVPNTGTVALDVTGTARFTYVSTASLDVPSLAVPAFNTSSIRASTIAVSLLNNSTIGFFSTLGGEFNSVVSSLNFSTQLSIVDLQPSTFSTTLTRIEAKGIYQLGNSTLYSYTGTYRTLITSTNWTHVYVMMWGAGGVRGGGNGAIQTGGGGAYVEGMLPIIPGETLRLIVGKGGGYNVTTTGTDAQGAGGGSGGNAGQGGGRSAIQRDNQDIIVAGGGGSASYGGGTGGAASWSGTGWSGNNVARSTIFFTSAGTLHVGAGGQNAFGQSSNTYQNGGKGVGGATTGNYCGGGGAGWYGGAGAQNQNSGGAGGSSYTEFLINAWGADAAMSTPGAATVSHRPAGVGQGGGGSQEDGSPGAIFIIPYSAGGLYPALAIGTTNLAKVAGFDNTGALRIWKDSYDTLYSADFGGRSRMLALDTYTTSTVTATASNLTVSSINNMIAPSATATDAFMVLGTQNSAGFDETFYSYDGCNWTRGSFSSNSGSAFNMAAWNGSYWLAGTGDSMSESGDGINWTKINTGLGNCLGVAWNGRMWVRYGELPTSMKMQYSYDGQTWYGSASASNFFTGRPAYTVGWGRDKWVVGGYKQNQAAIPVIGYSYDGMNWYSGNLSWTDRVNIVAFNGDYWLCGGKGGGTVAKSYDGINWSTVTTNDFGVNGLAWNGRTWVAVGETNNTQCMTSSNGDTWVVQSGLTSLGFGQLDDITWNGSKFFAIGRQTNIAGRTVPAMASSPDGSTWTYVSTLFGPTYFDNNGGYKKIRARIPLPNTGAAAHQTSYLSSFLLGQNPSTTMIQFPGLQGLYNTTAIGEVSTSATTQELLLFKGSSTSDTIRVQTTGSILFESGAPQRFLSTGFVSTMSVPTMIIHSSSNVGINLQTPGANLDVGGTARADILSSIVLNVSSINGAAPGIPNSISLSTLNIPFSTFNTTSTFIMQVSTASTLLAFGTNQGTTQSQFYVGDLFAQLNLSTISSPTFLIDASFPRQNLQFSTFRSSGSFTIPSGVTMLDLHMWGEGGQNGTGPGGGGAFLRGFYPVVSGETYRVVVGRGGGAATLITRGGGYSGIFRNNLSTVANLVACAGGGGGGGSFSTTIGGGAGVVTGKNGTYRNPTSGGGGGGTQVQITNTGADKLYGAPGEAGGGGGWYGGGQGGNNSVDITGGGGGSSLFSNLVIWAGEDGASGGLAGGKWSPYYASNYGDCNTAGAVVIAWSPGVRRANQLEIRDITQTRFIAMNENLAMGIRVSSLGSTFSLDVNELARISTLYSPLIVSSNFIIPFSTINPFSTTSTQAIFTMGTMSSGTQVAFGTTQAYGQFGKYSQVYIGDMKELQTNLYVSDPVLLVEQDYPLVPSADVVIVNFSTTVASYTVPANTIAAKCFLWGQGGRSGGTFLNGGNGAFVSGAFRVSGGDTLAISVNAGGGTGGSSAGAGGGYTGVFRSSVSQANAIAIAAGGGGGGSTGVGQGFANIPSFGGGGGVLTGNNGTYGKVDTSGAGGGTQTAGGSGSASGSALQGGGNSGTSGGGGGYFGGGGGGNNSVTLVGGGGGSSWINGLFPGSVVAEGGSNGTYFGENLAAGKYAPFYFSSIGAGDNVGWATIVFVKNFRRTNLLELRGPTRSTITGIDNYLNMGINVSTVLSSFNLDVGGTGRFVTMSTLDAQFSTLNGSTLTSYITAIAATGSNISTYSTQIGGVMVTAANISTMSTSYATTFSTVTAFVSSLTINSLQVGTGTGFLDSGPIRATAISTIQTNTEAIYANSTLLGSFSTQTAIRFFGLTGAYTNTAIAELSTGLGTQDLLFFKGSTTTDRIRLQTTGTIVFEPGVSARTYQLGCNYALATPAMIMDTASNVGIQIAVPTVPLDVNGIARFVTASTLRANASSLQANTTSTLSMVTSSIQGNFFSSIFMNASSIRTNEMSTLRFLASSINGVPAPFFITTQASTFSVNRIHTSSIITSSISSVFANFSTLTVNAITFGDGTGYVNLGDLLTTSLSTVAINTSNVFTNTISSSTIYNSGYLCTQTLVVFGPSTLIVQGAALIDSMSLLDPTTGGRQTLTIDQGFIKSACGKTYVSQCRLNSTVRGLGTAGYLSTIPETTVFGSHLASTVAGLSEYGYLSTGMVGNVKDSELFSTVASLGTEGFISSLTFTSTLEGLGSAGFISTPSLLSTVEAIYRDSASKSSLISTIDGLGASSYISSTGLASTVAGLSQSGYVSQHQLLFMVDNLGTVGYLSTQSMISTVNNLTALGYVARYQMMSTVAGLGSAGYISTPNELPPGILTSTNLISTSAGLGSLGYLSSPNLNNISSLSFTENGEGGSLHLKSSLLYFNETPLTGPFKLLVESFTF